LVPDGSVALAPASRDAAIPPLIQDRPRRQLTSPPDVIDALLFRSPTPFSAWGVVAMWAVFAAALLSTLRRRLRLRPLVWRRCRTTLAAVTVVGSVVHELLIEGTMGLVSKTVLCALELAAAAKVMADLQPWGMMARRRA
jgi:hypothetical protein